MSRPASLTLRPAQTSLVESLHQASGDLAVWALAGGIICLFMVSSVTLEAFGISYITSGGGALSKFHPGSLMIVGAVLLRCFASHRPTTTAVRLFTTDAGSLMLLVAVAIAALSAVFIVKTPVTPLFDTYVVPVLSFVLLRDLDPKIGRILAYVVILIFCANAVLATVEFLRHTHFYKFNYAPDASSDPTRSDVTFDWRVQLVEDWRSLALFGHPLTNGLLVNCFILCLLAEGADWLPGWLRVSVVLLQAASLFTFGARTSLVFTIAFGALILGRRMLEATRRGTLTTPRNLAVAFLVIGVTFAIGATLVASGFLDQTLDRFSNDLGSAHTRSTMFELFSVFSWNDLLFGPDQDVLATWQRVYGLEFGIESSVVGLALTYGLIVTAILIGAILAFSRSVVRATGPGTAIVFTSFLISVSGTASMSGKVTEFSLATIMCLLLLRKDGAPPPASALQGGG